MVTRREAPGGPAEGHTDQTELGELAGLAAEADAVEGRAQPPDPAQELQAATVDAQTEAAQVVELVASLGLPFVAWKWGQPVADLYGAAQRASIAQALAQVAIKRGWSIGGALASFGPELALCAALAGPVLPLVIAAATKPEPPPPAPATVEEHAAAVVHKPAAVDEPPQHAGLDGRVL